MKAAPLLLASLLLVAAVSASSIPPSQSTPSTTQSPASSPSTTNAAAPAKVASSTSRSRRPNDLAASHVYYKAKTLSGSTDSELSAMLSVDSKELLVDKLPGTGTDDETNNEKLVQEELAKAIKAQASKKTLRPISPAKVGTKPAAKKAAGLYDTADMVFNDEIDAGDEDDDEDEYEDDDDDDEEEEDEDDDDDDDDDEDDDEDDIIDDEEVMTGCPDYCRCAGQYPAATTARCRKLQDDQSFGSGIAHLKIENAGNIRLGPYALRRLGLRQLESISIVDTKIVELDRTAFDGLGELFVVNLTNNALTHIHPDTFQNNSQLSLLTIAGNPLSRSGKLQGRDYLLDAPSVTELDFSENQLTRLPRRAFAKMTNLAYINLKNNRLESLDKDLFAPLDELVELDLSHNSLSQLPASLFKDKNLLTLRISGNALRSLKSIKAAKLVTLDASANRLDSIAKEDLAGVPSLEQLYLRANNLRNIHQHAFSDLDQLTYLDLTNNNLGELHEHHLRANSRLQVLLLSDNPELKSLPIFRTNAQEFERYSIYRFECENCGLTYIEPGTFDAMAAMTRLNLAHNKLTGLPQGLLRSLSALRELDLSANRLERLEDNTFEGATSLTKLSVATNSFAGGLRVTPFLKTPNLMKLDASFCGMSRVWSETRVPLKSLKFLSLQKNSLARISVEELRVMPNLAGLDVSRNPLRCDEDLSAAVQWLSDNNVTPSESTRRSALGANKRNNHQDDDDDDNYESQPTEQFNQWSDLAKKRCDSWEGGPPPSRQLPIKPIKVTIKTKKVLQQQQQQTTKAPQDSLEFTIGGGPAFKFDFGRVDPSRESTWSLGSNSMNDDIDNAWDSSQDKDEYDQIGSAAAADDEDNDWYRDMIWQVAVLFGALTVALLVVQLALCLWKRRGGGNGSSRGPVLRSSMILRPGMMDTKNCGLVYKPLEEKIGSGDAPHLKHHHAAPPKRHNFYSSSTFHYDKIVPESV